ncbi:MAG: hypothetical protein ACLPKI_17070 [Streptosporangiaceae bacterium]
MRSCENGHANAPGAGFCTTCGASLRSGAPADRPYGGQSGTEYVSDYASGSFAEYIAALGEEPGGASGLPAFPPGPLTGAAPGDQPAPAPGGGFPVMLSAPLTVPPGTAADAPRPDNGRRVPSWPGTSGQDSGGPAGRDPGRAASRDGGGPDGGDGGGRDGGDQGRAASRDRSRAASRDRSRGPGLASGRDQGRGPGLAAGRDEGRANGPGWDDDGPATSPSPLLSAGALAELRYRKPSRARMLLALVAVAVLGAAGITGTLVVMHSRHPAAQAGLAQPGGSGRPGSQPGGTSARPRQPGVASQGVAQWTTPVPIAPGLASGITITGLACVRAGVCYAADSAGAVLAQRPAGHWPVAATDPAGGLVAISCPSAASCVAIDSQGESIVLSQGSWSSPAPIGTGSGTVTSLSCPRTGFCLAVDSIGQAFTYAGPSAGWSQQTITPSGQALNSVSCASTSDCVAVGAGGDVYSYDGSAWSGPDAVDNGHDLVSVSCPSAGFCMAVDSAGQAAQFSAGQWTVQPLGFTATAVSCPAVGTCLAAGRAGVASYGGDHWMAPSGVDPAGLSLLDCVAVNSCVATDQSSNVLYYTASAK